MSNLKNIPLKEFRNYLLKNGLKLIRTKGGHEVWARSDLTRPVILQAHVDPVPEFIIRNCLRAIGTTPEDLMEFSGRH
ncbi:MAG: type II toxin-antitoxin system HicA family toxin [Bacteroidia bacterium]|nr:type II toxin-antitoxin system HicA family toxin [Bacteroidia bacterium]